MTPELAKICKCIEAPLRMTNTFKKGEFYKCYFKIYNRRFIRITDMDDNFIQNVYLINFDSHFVDIQEDRDQKLKKLIE